MQADRLVGAEPAAREAQVAAAVGRAEVVEHGEIDGDAAAGAADHGGAVVVVAAGLSQHRAGRGDGREQRHGERRGDEARATAALRPVDPSSGIHLGDVSCLVLRMAGIKPLTPGRFWGARVPQQ